MSYRRFGRKKDVRQSLFRNVLSAFIEHGKIETTEAKAKEIRKFADYLITLAKRGDLASRRLAISKLGSNAVAVQRVRKLFDEIAPKYAERQGGYTRVLKLGQRRGDGAPMALLELV